MSDPLKQSLLGIGLTIAFLAAIEGLARLVSPPAGPQMLDLPPKPPGTYRVIALGGSTVAGVPAPRLGFVAQVEAALRGLLPGRRIQVMNLGRPGGSSSDVLQALEAVLDAQPDLVIVLTGHNEFLDPSRGFRTSVRRVLDHLALARLLRRQWHKVRFDWAAFNPPRLVPYDRRERWFRDRIRAYRSNLAEIIRFARSRKVSLLLCTAPANLADWPPARRHLSWAVPRPGYDADVERIERLIRGGNPIDAEEEIVQALREYRDDAMLLYLLAKVNLMMGRQSEARVLFVRAKDLDPLPFRALSDFNDAIRSHVGVEGVRVVDAERAFERFSEGGLVGFGLVADNCHPTPLGHALLAREIIREMARAGYLPNRDADLGAPEAWLDAYVNERWHPAGRHRLQLNWYLATALRAMRHPFYNYSVARRHLEEALSLEPGRWDILANLAALAFFEDEVGKGREYLARAIELKGGPLDPNDGSLPPDLREALERRL